MLVNSVGKNRQLIVNGYFDIFEVLKMWG